MGDQHTDEKTEPSGEARKQEKADKKLSRVRWFLYGAGSLFALEAILAGTMLIMSSFTSLENRGSTSSQNASEDISLRPFPWPPPRASAEAVIPRRFFGRPGQSVVRLGDVNHILAGALDLNGYYDKSYYGVPDGFALVTRLEQINPDGTPKSLPSRWELEIAPLSEFSVSAYLRALLTANPGYYRIIVFVVTSHPFSQTNAQVTKDEAMNCLNAGFERLLPVVSALEFTEMYGCTALASYFPAQK